MKSKITLTITALFILTSSIINSQTSLSGYVTDAETGEPLIGANLILLQNKEVIKELITDIDGKYSISDITAGIYNIEAFYTGYETQLRNAITVKEDIDNKVDFMLSTGNLMDEIIVTNSKVKTVKQNNAMKSSIASGESRKMIRGYAVTTKSDYIAEASLPNSGQVTTGEWNDLHNWKDWEELMQNEDYQIMNHRFNIYPTRRYSVLILNDEGSVLPNIEVQLKNHNVVLWQSITDNSGKAELWSNPFSEIDKINSYTIHAGDKVIRNPKYITEGTNTIKLDQHCGNLTSMDIVFVVDATSSMNDEIQYLKSELIDVISRVEDTNDDVTYRTGSVFYRDINDDYITRISDLSNDHTKVIDFVTEQNAQGGGDKPEAVDAALEDALSLDWNADASKLIFLLLDASPHEDEGTMTRIRRQITEAALRGIKIIPITASGINRDTEFLMKFMAIMTNGTYVFITDDSGIGNAHLTPIVDDYEVEKLNDCIVRLITQYSHPYSCNEQNESNGAEINISIFPNPCTQFINVQSDVTPDKIKIHSSNGMIVKSINPTHKTTRIGLEELISGVYTVSIHVSGTIDSKQIIVLR